MGYAGSEKRKYQRLNATYIINYRPEASFDPYSISQTIDIGGGGAIIATDKKIDKGSNLDLLVKFPFIPENLKITAEVLDSKEVIAGSIYHTRIKFIDLPAEYGKKIEEFIRGKSRNV